MCAISLEKLLRRGSGTIAVAMVAMSLPASAADSATSTATIFDPNPAAILFPITASWHEAQQVAFGGSNINRLSMSFSSGAPGKIGFQQSAKQQVPAAQRSKGAPKRGLPIGCEALGSIKSPLGSLAGRCMAGL